MPTTTVISTTTMTTISSGHSSCSSSVAALTTVTTVSTVNDEQNVTADGKRKTPSEHSDDTSPKRRNVDGHENELAPAILQSLFNELTQIREEVRSGNKKMDDIKTENSEWKAKLCTFEMDMTEVKTSIAEVQDLVSTEVVNR